MLSQVSSCSLERVFSQLKLIRDTCGDNMLEDMTEIRMILRTNGDLDVWNIRGEFALLLLLFN